LQVECFWSRSFGREGLFAGIVDGRTNQSGRLVAFFEDLFDQVTDGRFAVSAGDTAGFDP